MTAIKLEISDFEPEGRNQEEGKRVFLQIWDAPINPLDTSYHPITARRNKGSFPE
jgi:hypothetical protein